MRTARITQCCSATAVVTADWLSGVPTCEGLDFFCDCSTWEPTLFLGAIAAGDWGILLCVYHHFQLHACNSQTTPRSCEGELLEFVWCADTESTGKCVHVCYPCMAMGAK